MSKAEYSKLLKEYQRVFDERDRLLTEGAELRKAIEVLGLAADQRRSYEFISETALAALGSIAVSDKQTRSKALDKLAEMDAPFIGDPVDDRQEEK